MHLGAVIPQNELGQDTSAIIEFALSAEELGFDHLLAYDHVLGADRGYHRSLIGPYGLDDTFREPFVLFGHLSALTSLSFATAILIAPQRQTALIAKQAAEVDLLCGGKLRLGVGIGWNPVEYEALGIPFEARGARLAEQIDVLRQLWTTEQITSHIGPEKMVAAGLAPLPIQRPIPIWMGGMAPAALRRVGRLADGWFPMAWPGAGFEEQLEIVRSAARAAGRDERSLGIEGQVPAQRGAPEKTASLAERWRLAGATHLSISTLNQGHVGLAAHLASLRTGATALGL